MYIIVNIDYLIAFQLPVNICIVYNYDVCAMRAHCAKNSSLVAVLKEVYQRFGVSIQINRDEMTDLKLCRITFSKENKENS